MSIVDHLIQCALNRNSFFLNHGDVSFTAKNYPWLGNIVSGIKFGSAQVKKSKE